VSTSCCVVQPAAQLIAVNRDGLAARIDIGLTYIYLFGNGNRTSIDLIDAAIVILSFLLTFGNPRPRFNIGLLPVARLEKR
jgi:hypothetical protein